MTTRPPILTESQQKLIREATARITKADDWAPEIGRRQEVSRSLRTLTAQSRVLEGASITSDHLAEMIRLEWKIQNLNAITMPRLIGTYGYYRHFKDYKGTREEFPGYLTGQKENWIPDSAGYRGVDLDLFSKDLKALLTSQGDSFVLALDQFLTHPGVGKAFATGLLLLYDPKRYPLVNNASCAPFEEGGACPLTKEQKKRMRRVVPEAYAAAGAVVEPNTVGNLSWILLFEDVRSITGLADFLELDWFLWNWAQGQKGETDDPDSKRRRADPEWLTHLVAGVNDAKRIEIRRAGEEKARRLIQQNLGQLTEDQLLEIPKLLSADYVNGKARTNRFGGMFLSYWNRRVQADADAAARWVSQLWEASDNEIPVLIGEFTQSQDMYGRLSFPSAILYLRDPERFNFCTWRLQVGLERALGRRIQKSRTSQAFAEFNSGIKELRERFGIPPQAIDLLLLRASEKQPVVLPPKPVDGAMERLVEDTLYDPEFFVAIEALLEEKPQVIFSGPPGTGKTYVAEKFALYMAGHEDRVEIVQFHPSYGYEDFIEGLRPVPGDGQVRYEVVPGIFRRLCDRARRQPEKKFVLIVDELNRGNLPRIFGELLLLLERRGQKARLPYSQDEFMIPPNLYLIGTMNTADHSIALVDFALRRRFHFVDFQPDAEILRRWLNENLEDMVWVARFMSLINAALRERNVDPQWAIGHTHFMHPRLDEERLFRIWDHSIRPTLEEYFYGDPKSLRYFDCEALMDKARQLEAAQSEEEEDDVGESLIDGSAPIQ